MYQFHDEADADFDSDADADTALVVAGPIAMAMAFALVSIMQQHRKDETATRGTPDTLPVCGDEVCGGYDDGYDAEEGQGWVFPRYICKSQSPVILCLVSRSSESLLRAGGRQR